MVPHCNLRALAAGALVAAALAVPASAATCTASPAWPVAEPAAARAVVDLVNRHRAGLGLRRLSVSPTLTTAAEWKARHLAAYDYFEHDDPAEGGLPAQSWAQRITACGFPPAGGQIGENIAFGQPTAQEVFDAWLASPGHRENLERTEFAVIGVGAARGPGGRWTWAQDFGSIVDAGPGGGSGPSGSATVTLARGLAVGADGRLRLTLSRRALVRVVVV